MTLTNLDNQCDVTQSMIVTPDMEAPTAIIAPVGDLDCNVSEIVLDGSNSNGSGTLSYSWQLDGIVIAEDVEQLTISAPGAYDLIVFDSNNNCATTTSAFIELNNQEPEISIDTPVDLDCDRQELMLDANFSSDDNLSFSWSTIDGSIVSGSATANPLINAAGEYFLSVENETTGCTNSTSILVNQNGDIPVFAIAADADLNCDNSIINIVADIPSGNFDFVWTNLDNGVVLSSSSEILEVSEEGNYIFN